MREIKFRAWDKRTKKMEYHDFIIYPENGKCEFPEGGWDLYGQTEPEEDFILMQYTGLKDKNGKEIYELHELNHRYRVIYKAPKYVLQEISTGDIIEIYGKQDEREITGEYSPLEEDKERSIN